MLKSGKHSEQNLAAKEPEGIKGLLQFMFYGIVPSQKSGWGGGDSKLEEVLNHAALILAFQKTPGQIMWFKITSMSTFELYYISIMLIGHLDTASNIFLILHNLSLLRLC